MVSKRRANKAAALLSQDKRVAPSLLRAYKVYKRRREQKRIAAFRSVQMALAVAMGAAQLRITSEKVGMSRLDKALEALRISIDTANAINKIAVYGKT